MKKLISNILIFIRDNSAIFLILLTFVYVGSTMLILRQQTRSEYINSRAYISVKNTSLLKVPVSDFDYEFQYQIQNYGNTPAKNITTSYGYPPNSEIFNQGAVEQDFFSPGQSKLYILPVNQKLFDQIKKGSEKFLTVRISYTDYLNREHAFISEYMTINRGGEFLIITNRQYEI